VKNDKLNMMKRFLYTTLTLLVLLTKSSCTKLVEVNPPSTSTNSENIYQDEETAITVLNGIYTQMSQASGGFFSSSSTDLTFSIRMGAAADELDLFGNVTNEHLINFYHNSLSVVNSLGGSDNYWKNWYQMVYYCNSAIEGLSAKSNVPGAVKNQLLGEALFIRSFYLFYLVNSYGDVPLVLTTSVPVNSSIAKSSKATVYTQIIADLKKAESLLSSDFLDGKLQGGSPERVRAYKWAATALLSRIFLYTGENIKAEESATNVINQTSLFSLSDPSGVFLRTGLGNPEVILQIQPVRSGWNTEDARYYVINGSIGNSRPVYASQSLLSAFEPGDLRRSEWLRDTSIGGSPISYVFKYKRAKLNDPVNEYHMVLRLAEQYLIRAEARALQGNTSGAVEDLNTLRGKRRSTPTVDVPEPLPALPGSLIQEQVLDAIARERRVELFGEFGHRWFDLKRTGKIDEVMTIAAQAKGTTWYSHQQLFPIPQSELDFNSNMTQNPNY
jgi:starch-binding outer membrane protein, SusD/RagB family